MPRTLIGLIVAGAWLLGPSMLSATAQTGASPPPATAGGAYPPCSKTVTDHCIQLWQPGLSKAYPQCVKIKRPAERAACIEKAFAESGK